MTPDGSRPPQPSPSLQAVFQFAKFETFREGCWFVAPERIEGGSLVLACCAVGPYGGGGGVTVELDGHALAARPLQATGEAEDILKRLEGRAGRPAYFEVRVDIGGRGTGVLTCRRSAGGAAVRGRYHLAWDEGRLRSRRIADSLMTRTNRAGELVFALTGFDDYVKLREIFAPAPSDRPMEVLDWGVGSARVAQFFLEDAAFRVSGCDIDPVNTQALHDTGHDPDRFKLMEPDGRIPFDDDTFDAVYGVSVFTHLTAPLQDFYLAELVRVMRPGAVGVFSVHGAVHFFARINDMDVLARVASSGLHVVGDNDDLEDGFQRSARSGLYVDTLHHAPYVIDHWGGFFSDVRVVSAPTAYQHDLVVCRR